MGFAKGRGQCLFNQSKTKTHEHVCYFSHLELVQHINETQSFQNVDICVSHFLQIDFSPTKSLYNILIKHNVFRC